MIQTDQYPSWLKSVIYIIDASTPSVVDVVGPMNPYQPIPFHILSLAVFQSRIFVYAGSNIEIAEEKKVFDRNIDI